MTGQKKRIQEIVALATEKGFDIPEKSIKHYAKDNGEVEYVLVRWWGNLNLWNTFKGDHSYLNSKQSTSR